MNTELYQQLFNKLDSLWAIRKDLTFWCEVQYGDDWKIKFVSLENDDENIVWLYTRTNNITWIEDLEDYKIIWHPPIYTDVIDWVNEATKEWMYLRDTAEKVLYEIISKWDLSKPLLSDQSDELGEYLLTLLR